MVEWVLQIDLIKLSRAIDPHSRYNVAYVRGHFVVGNADDVLVSVKLLRLEPLDISAEMFCGDEVFQVKISLGGGYGHNTFSPGVLLLTTITIIEPLPPPNYESLISEGLFLRLPTKLYKECRAKNNPSGPKGPPQTLVDRLQHWAEIVRPKPEENDAP